MVNCGNCGKEMAERRGGHKRKFCSLLCFGQSISKNNNNRPRPSQRNRKRIKEKLGLQCEICGFDRCFLDAAHIISYSKNGPLREWNLIALCPNHHRLFDLNKLTEEEYSKISDKISKAKEEGGVA